MSQRIHQRRQNRKRSSSCEEESSKSLNTHLAERHKGSRSQLNCILKQCEDLLMIMGVPCVKSFGEAEALCAQLDEAGMVDGCITQDGDCFLYGARTVYRNFTISHHGPTGCSVEEYKMTVIEEKLALSRQKLIALSLLCGCDYNAKGVLGVGKETALKFLEGLKDDQVLPRLKQWRTDPYYERLETEYAALGKTCSKCNHAGKLQKHSKSGCEICGTKYDCIETTDLQHLSQKDPEERKYIIAELTMRRKALQDENFPSHAMVEEFLHRQPLSKLDLSWKQPDIASFIKYSNKLLSWPESYAMEKFIPLVTRWQLHNLQNSTMNSHQTALPFIPTTIIKKRILKGVQSFEVKWKDNQGLLCNLELAKQLLVTTEPQEMFRTAYPDLVEEYMKEKEAKSRKGKTTGSKLKTKTASEKIRSCQCKENGEDAKYKQQGHICAFVKSSANDDDDDDVSKTLNMMGNLDINSEVGKGNLKNSCHKDAEQRRLDPKITKKQQKLMFNYLCSKAIQSTENNIQQMSQKNTRETNMENGFKLKRDALTLNGDKENDVDQCNRFPYTEVCVQRSSLRNFELADENLLCKESVRKGIMEEYDCLDVDDEIMDMSSIIENIVHGPSSISMPQN